MKMESVRTASISGEPSEQHGCYGKVETYKLVLLSIPAPVCVRLRVMYICLFDCPLQTHGNLIRRSCNQTMNVIVIFAQFPAHSCTVCVTWPAWLNATLKESTLSNQWIDEVRIHHC